jgi:hypothetical protein
MPVFTIETTYRLPVFRQRSYTAASPTAACELAIADADWSDQRDDLETSGPTYVTGVWQGADAAYRGEAVAIPPAFGDATARLSQQVETLLAILGEPAQTMGLSATDFAGWLPHAKAAIAEAEALLRALEG